MRFYFAFLLIVSLSGCATEILQSYVGKSITEPTLDYGPATNIVELGGGRRAYQWATTNSGVMPITSPTTTNIYGSGGYATAYTSSTTYVPYSNDCLYTLTATQKGSDWIVDGIRQPTLACM